MHLSFSLPIPLIGTLYVELVPTDAFRGRIISGVKYKGEYHFRLGPVHGIYTPRNWKPHAPTQGNTPR